MFLRLLAAAAFSLTFGLTTSACMSTGEVDGNEPPPFEPVDPQHGAYDRGYSDPDYGDDWSDPSQDQQDLIDRWSGSSGVDGPGPDPTWVCTYAPTYDRDWHNDVLCTNGVDSRRPYLRPGDSYITPDEIMDSARIYENQLNRGR